MHYERAVARDMILPDLDLGLRKIIWQKEDFTKLCKDVKDYVKSK